MTRFAGMFAARTLRVLPMIFIILTLNFFLLRLAPGDIATTIAGQSGSTSIEEMAAIRAKYGLDQPLLAQYWHYLGKVLRLDFGTSYYYNTSVTGIFLDRLPATLILMAASFAISLGGGIVLGVVAAFYRGRLVDQAISLLTLVMYSTPVFWLALMMIVLFGVNLGWLPTGGMTSSAAPEGAALWLDIAAHLVMPAVALGTFYLAVYARLMRAATVDALTMDYVRTARAKGAGPFRIVVRHAARNSLVPVVSMAGVQMAALLGGSVLVESVFAWPGVGRLLFDSVMQRDYNLLLFVLLMSSVIVMAVNILVDFSYAWLDPRVQRGAL